MSGEPRSRRLGLDEQHRAEEVIAALIGFAFRIEGVANVVQQAAGLVLRPGERALVWRNLNKIGIGEQLPKRHGLGAKRR